VYVFVEGRLCVLPLISELRRAVLYLSISSSCDKRCACPLIFCRGCLPRLSFEPEKEANSVMRIITFRLGH
jgi:hypothetical protein